MDIKDVCDYDGRTPLHLAASEGAFATTEWLLQQGVRLDALDRFGRTPLMDALLAERTPVAQLLLEARPSSPRATNTQILSGHHHGTFTGGRPPREACMKAPAREGTSDGHAVCRRARPCTRAAR